MRRLMIFLVILSLALGLSIAYAETTSVEAVYAKAIDLKIAQREAQGKLLDSKGSRNLLCDGKTAADQAKFYKSQRDRLIREMADQKVGDNARKIEFFLIKSYFDFTTRRTLYACKSGI